MNIFYLYLITVVSFLVIFSFFVSLQLKTCILTLANFVGLTPVSTIDQISFQETYLKYISYYLLSCDYFSCVLLSELLLERNVSVKEQKVLCISLGSIYRNMSFWTFAEYYYLESISVVADDIDILLDLANLYFNLGAQIKLRSICNQILYLYPSYQIPEYLLV